MVIAEQLDEQILHDPPPADEDALAQVTLTIEEMALGGESRSLDRLHLVFETNPEWREIVAVAIAKYSETQSRRAQDWRLLVRSLAVVEGEDARTIMRALLGFRQRSTKPRWQRQLILLGLQLGDNSAEDTVNLLKHWTGVKVEPNEQSENAMANWQAWFAKTYPDQPTAVLPQLPAEAKWQYEALRHFLGGNEGVLGDAQRGRSVFERADCFKCHRYGKHGEVLGPDLTQISGRMQRKEILHAILFPSELVPDQFLTYSVVIVDGRTLTGIVGRSGSDEVVILQTNGEKVTLKKDQIEESVLNKQSAMPVGTLERLTKQEIADLFAFMQSRSE